MGSFNGQSFDEGFAASTFPTWPASTTILEKLVPNETPTLKNVGADPEQFGLLVRCTKAQLTALYDEVSNDGSLVMAWETHDALLVGVSNAAEVGVDKDVYRATLNLIRL